jgi:hypothetical protein
LELEYIFSIPTSLNPSFFKTLAEAILFMKWSDFILGEINFSSAYSNKYLLDSVA